MSNSVKKKAAHSRMKYSGELYKAALAGIPNDRSHGLDSFAPQQRQLNAMLALGLFNRGDEGASPKRWTINTLTWYTIKVSPRWNRLVFIADAPMNVAQYLVPDSENYLRVPGMRLRGGVFGSCYVLEHVPTGGELVVTDDPNGKAVGRLSDTDRRMLSLDTPLLSEEKRLYAALPVMTPDAQTLLAGVAVRMSMADPGRRWATGNWYWDPLQRMGHTEVEGYGDPQRRLWGEGDEWEAQWTGYPYAQDVALALTDPVIGVRDAKLSTRRHGYEVTLKGSVLKIRR
ncbi:hypothetical protein AB0O01_27905 [Streptomyces sp. NPDC093252]|uniref:hypothetical protein n=1 Tax=Streptomyces sp. NPDC093252 TaxID=3154980 RepID=UPI0034249B49